MNTRCLLISPPGESNVFPRGIMEIATFLNSRGCHTRVLPLVHYYREDYHTDECGYVTESIPAEVFRDILAAEIRSVNPAVVGVSAMYTSDFPHCVEIVRICKQIAPDIITVMGGQHVTFRDAESLEIPELDVVVRGEGEWTLLDIISTVQAGGNLQSIPGTTVRTNGEIRRNPSRPFGDLSESLPVDFALLPEAYVKNASINGILHRGCAFHCNYCVEKKFWRHPRAYPVEKVVAEMRTLETEYGTQMIGFEESMLDMRHKPFFRLMSAIKEAKLTIPRDFSLTTRIDTVTDEGIRILKEIGVYILCAGIENFSPQVLKMMNKKQDRQAIAAGCRKLRDNNIWLNAY